MMPPPIPPIKPPLPLLFLLPLPFDFPPKPILGKVTGFSNLKEPNPSSLFWLSGHCHASSPSWTSVGQTYRAHLQLGWKVGNTRKPSSSTTASSIPMKLPPLLLAPMELQSKPPPLLEARPSRAQRLIPPLSFLPFPCRVPQSSGLENGNESVNLQIYSVQSKIDVEKYVPVHVVITT